MTQKEHASVGPNRPAPSAPDLPYEPRDPQQYQPGIGLIGCGAITTYHLDAYRKAGYRVVALCDPVAAQREKRRTEFFPAADLYADHRQLLERDDVEVVDIATHPHQRPPLIEAAIDAGKHVLSQKPFVLDLEVGRKLADRADRQGVRLAVNQNGRWAPHFSYIRQAVAGGLIGQVHDVHFAVQWDHTPVRGTEFENVRHLILYDFAIHWFDLLSCLAGGSATGEGPAGRVKQVVASMTRLPAQEVRPALLAQALVQYERAQASLVFGGHTLYGGSDTTFVAGTRGTLASAGVDLHKQQVTLTTEAGSMRPNLRGDWFPDGFHGTMGELLCAIEEGREPEHSARNNLDSLALSFAAVASAERGEPVVPGTVQQMVW